MSRKLWRSGEKTNFHRKELFLKPAGTAVVVLFTLRSFLKYGLQAESTTLWAEYCVSSHERVTSMKSSSSFRLLKDKKFLIDISMISLLTFSWYLEIFYLCFISLIRIFEWRLSLSDFIISRLNWLLLHLRQYIKRIQCSYHTKEFLAFIIIKIVRQFII